MTGLKFSAIILVLLIVCFAQAQPSESILRIENGMHTAKCSRVSVDDAGKYILTCSEDKTARLWDAATGQQLKVFRIPIGGTDEGKLYACALSSNGALAAVAGWTGWEWESSDCIYIIKTSTGEILGRLKGLSTTVFDLEFSPDNKYLAAGVVDSTGLYIYSMATMDIYKRIGGYRDAICNIAFDQQGRMATASYDGKVRMYEKDFSLLRESSNLAGISPFSLAFNPEGTRLAIGYENIAAIEVRDPNTLQLLYKPILGDLADDADVHNLSFSDDGSYLYGGSVASLVVDGKWKTSLRRWSSEGRGTFIDIPLLKSSIFDLKPLTGGRMIILGAYPDMVVIDKNGEVIWQKQAGINDYRYVGVSQFGVSENGMSFVLSLLNESPYVFDINMRSLSEGAVDFSLPTDKSSRITITDWKDSYNPLLNGKKISFLQVSEKTRSVDITSDGRFAIMGGEWNLYKVDEKAEMIWSIPLPGAPWAMNISGNNKVAIVALADGTIRWYRVTDGKELLAFYIHADMKRWVLFTPTGYYDASPGAEELLGWHLNNGPDRAPDFYPVSRFKEQYYRPELIDAIFETYDEDEAVRLANSRSVNKITKAGEAIREKLPPTIIISNPINGSSFSNNTVTINYKISSPANTEVKNLRVLVNGRPISQERGVITTAGDEKTMRIAVPSQDVTVTLLAENENGISPEANLILKWAKATASADEFIIKPKLYVLAIGVSDYNNPDLKLGLASKDASDFAAALYKQKGNLYSDVVIKKLINKHATKDSITDGLDWIQRQTGQKDVAMIFFAGHGINDNNGVYYMLPVGADMDRIRTTCLNFEELKQTVSSIAGKVVVFIDACHSGNAMGSGRRGGGDINSIVNELSNSENGAITFTSSTGKEFSLEDPSWGNGAFTKAVIEGLGGKAAIAGKSKITVKSLDAYISERVKEITNGKQHPTSVTPPNVPDFPIGVSH